MENPLKKNFSKAEKSNELGRASRKIKRQQRKEVIFEKALDIFQAHLPWMTDTNPTCQRFNERWPLIDNKLREDLTNERHYRLAYNHLCYLLEQGKRAGLWDIELPEPFIVLPQARATRPESWQKYACVASDIYKKGLFEVAPDTLPTSLAFAQLLLSMIFHGGLNRTDQWVAVGKCLEQDKPLEGNQDLLFLRLTLGGNTKTATNARYWDEEKQTYVNNVECVYVPDPISLGLVNQFLRRKEPDWKSPSTVAGCLALINELSDMNIKSKALRFGGIALAEHIQGISLPQILVQVALGKQTTSSLPKPYWDRLYHPEVNPPLDTGFQFFAYVKSSPNQFVKRENINAELPFFYENLKDIFNWTHNEKKSPSQLSDDLRKIAENDLAPAQALLLKWLLHLLEERKNTPSTLKRYFHCLALRWLIESQDVDFTEMNSEDFFEFYQDILDQIISSKERHYCAARLDDLHQFAITPQGFPPLAESLSVGNENQPHVSSGFVDEILFQRLLEQFDRLSDLSSFEIKMYKCFLIAAYRTGLRPGELAKLRIKDVEPSKTAWLSIRSNKYGSNKTASAKRKIPLMPLLTQAEQNIVKEYIHERNLYDNKLTSLFFCQLNNVYQKINSLVLSRATREILTYLSGGVQYRFYHLRHSALSRMQLILHNQELDYPPAIKALIPYDNAQCKAIFELICGKNRTKVRYYALAAFAGHSDPSVTLANYLHFSDVIIGLIMQQNATELSAQQTRVLYGLSDYQVREHRKIYPDMTVKDIAGKIKNKLNAFVKKPVRRIDKKGREQKFDSTPDSPRKFADDYEVAVKLLQKIQENEDYANFAWHYNLTENQVAQWVNAAEALRELETSKKNSRLFSPSCRSQLVPTVLQDKSERDDFQQAMKNYRLHFNSAGNNEDLLWVIEYALTHCNSSRSGIYFEHADEYQRFMDVASVFFPSTRWRFLLKFTQDKIIKGWKYKSVELTCYRKKQAGRFANGAGWLLLKHQNEADKIKEGLSRYSSHAFQVFLHRLAIILFTEQEIRDW